ncbi:MAG: molybdopterin-guanine dinucleotide biosynthesis protein B [Gammaproteobacteria bacterium]|nr:MAG: molybdopterin-guanine dinucleotide biosynthesis protein B [Gammaproteobacteria bacterium]
MAEIDRPLPLLGFAAWSGTGKTTLLERLIPLLRAEGLRIALVKHAHHRFDIDQPGKDSYRLRAAGAGQVLVCSAQRSALVVEHPEPRDPVLAEQLRWLDPGRADLVLVEGFRHEAFPKIELHRPELGKPLLHPEDPHIIAVATPGARGIHCELPLLDLDAPHTLRDFIMQWLATHTRNTP